MTTLNDNKVALSIVVDRSGSMDMMNPKEICGSLNSLIADQVATGKEILVWFSTFDDNYETPHRGVPGKNVSITEDQITPRGLTALYDAMQYAISDLGYDLRGMTDRPGKVIMVILTDGEENSSTQATRSQVMDMVTEQRSTYSWEFIFLGANQDAIGNGADIGIDQHTSCDFDYSPAGCGAVLRTTSNAINRTLTGETPQVEFTNEERLESQLIDTNGEDYYDEEQSDNDDVCNGSEESQYFNPPRRMNGISPQRTNGNPHVSFAL